MSTLLAVWSFETSRRLFQSGILLAGVGSGVIGLGTVGFIARLWRPRPAPPPPPDAPAARAAADGFIVNPALAIASILLVAGFILMLLSVHYGVQPFSPRKG